MVTKKASVRAIFSTRLLFITYLLAQRASDANSHISLRPKETIERHKPYCIPNICQNRGLSASSLHARAGNTHRSGLKKGRPFETLSWILLEWQKRTDHRWDLCKRRQGYPNYTLEGVQHSNYEKRNGRYVPVGKAVSISRLNVCLHVAGDQLA